MNTLRKPHCALALLLLSSCTLADVAALAPDQWPGTVAQAVPQILAVLSPTTRSIIPGTPRDSLVLLQAELGEDIRQRLGLDHGNTALVAAACGRPCSIEQATLRLMEATWQALTK